MCDSAAATHLGEAVLCEALHDARRAQGFARVVQLAADLLEAPMALLWLRSGVALRLAADIGLDPADRPFCQSFCQHVISRHEAAVVEVHAEDGVRFAAGAALFDGHGEVVGALCVLDHRPRAACGDRERRGLTSLAEVAVEQIDLWLERGQEESRRAEADLIVAMQNALAGQPSFHAAIEAGVRHILGVTGAAYCKIWEWSDCSEFLHLMSFVVRDPRDEIRLARLREPISVPPDDLAIQEVFTAPDNTIWRILMPEAEAAERFKRAWALGIRSMAACSLISAGRRFVVALSFEGVPDGLPATAALLKRLSEGMRPVLQRKLDDERLNLLDLALASTNDGVLIVESINPRELQTRIVFANPAVSVQFGYSPQELIGQSPRLLQTEDGAHAELKRVDEAMWAGQSVHTELPRKRRDGSIFWGEVTVNPLFNEQGRLTHWVSIQRDTTEKRAAAAAQQERERAISAVANRLLRSQRLAKLGYWRWIVDTDILEWAETNYSMFGVSAARFTPTVSAVVAMIHPDDQPRMLENMRRATTDGAAYAHEYRVISPDGQLRHIWSEAVCEHDAGGKLIAVSGILQDFTERAEAQEMLMRSEKLRSIGQLTGGIAHDFNNLLTVVSVNLEIMGDYLEPDHPAEALRVTAMRAAESGAQLTANLLAFARRQPLQPEPVQINRLLEDIRDLAVHSIGARHVITLQLKPDLPECLLDRSGFEGAVLNLLLNSRDAMLNGGTIKVETDLCRLPCSTIGRGVCLEPGSYICVTVTDEGAGIPPELLERVFEPFFTTKAPGKGSGLGLSTVIGFVRQSGGDAELASQPGEGTMGRLYLPIFSPGA
jgi:PAS domain S-box-containing protein